MRAAFFVSAYPLPMHIATWNLNSLRVRLPHVLEWLEGQNDTIVGLQELKLADEDFPFEALREAGWHAVCNGQKTYNGVAILARSEPTAVQRDMPEVEDPQKRVIAATVDGVRIICAYVPNGQSVDSQKYHYKIEWLQQFRDFVAAEARVHPELAVVGDFNIAPTPEDTHDPESWEGRILCSGPERAGFEALLDLGLTDSFTKIPTPEQRYTWWDYRAAGFRRNLGLRIDHVLLSQPLAERVTGWEVDLAPRRLERPSDHAPVIARLD